MIRDRLDAASEPSPAEAPGEGEEMSDEDRRRFFCL